MLPESLTPEVIKQIEIFLSTRKEDELKITRTIELIEKELWKQKYTN